MDAPQISLSELRPGRCARIVVTRMLRFCVDMLLLDDQPFLIQKYVSVHWMNTFRELLREKAMYELSGFDVTRSINHIKLCDSVVSIRPNEFTMMFEVAAVANLISDLY
ncbi:hypothetical protein Rs2_46630 [Raphanus sativus]|nr:hypothetical protein Rs2_46630 [Raphanus sativus]